MADASTTVQAVLPDGQLAMDDGGFGVEGASVPAGDFGALPFLPGVAVPGLTVAGPVGVTGGLRGIVGVVGVRFRGVATADGAFFLWCFAAKISWAPNPIPAPIRSTPTAASSAGPSQGGPRRMRRRRGGAMPGTRYAGIGGGMAGRLTGWGGGGGGGTDAGATRSAARGGGGGGSVAACCAVRRRQVGSGGRGRLPGKPPRRRRFYAVRRARRRRGHG